MSMSQKEFEAFLNKLEHTQEQTDRIKMMAEPIHWCLGLAGEVGEVMDLIKKSAAYGRPLDHDKLLLELGDVYNYFTRLCMSYNISVNVVRQSNYDKLVERWPDLKIKDYD